MNRRLFLRDSAIVSLGFMGLLSCRATFRDQQQSGAALFGLSNDPEAYLDLPPGFSYRVISRVGTNMSDGFLVPGRPDGMGTFQREDGKVIIVRNHENSPESLADSPFGPANEKLSAIDPTHLFDPGKGELPGIGGTTTLVFDEESGEVSEEFLSLAGTYRNCAGGVTPWGSWLTCEEDVTRANGRPTEQNHGFVFEVPAFSTGLTKPIPLKAMGRFNHEAVAVDPKSGIVYLTEDCHDGLIYRFIPNTPGKLQEGGELQALVIQEQASLDTRNWEEPLMREGQSWAVSWLTLDNVEAPKDDLRLRGFKAGAARFARGEGIWMGEGELYFACTNGGPDKFGQIFRYTLSPHEGTSREMKKPGHLELFMESHDKTVLHMCDNLTIAPNGDIFVCEDNGKLNRIHHISKEGQITPFAINRSSDSEFAGVVFSPSGKTLFVNIQENGETLAITGPWEDIFVA